MIPLIFDLSDRTVVIFGGGKVGERKAKLFSKYAESVIVISRDFTPGIRRLKSVRLEKVQDLASSDFDKWISDSFLIVPATNDLELNRKITEVAKDAGKLVNTVNEELKTDFIVPSIIHHHDLLVAISTGGKSPALSKFIRLRIEKELGEGFVGMMKLQNVVRTALKKTALDQNEREKLLWKLLNNRKIWNLLDDGKYTEARKLAVKLLKDEGIKAAIR